MKLAVHSFPGRGICTRDISFPRNNFSRKSRGSVRRNLFDMRVSCEFFLISHFTCILQTNTSNYKRRFNMGSLTREPGSHLCAHCRDKSQRQRTAGCNKVYFSRYYVKLASLAELELFKKHSAAVVAVGSLNMHGGKCVSPPPLLLRPPKPSLPNVRQPTCRTLVLFSASECHLRGSRPPFLLPPSACNYPCTFADVAECRRV